MPISSYLTVQPETRKKYIAYAILREIKEHVQKIFCPYLAWMMRKPDKEAGREGVAIMQFPQFLLRARFFLI